MTATALAAGAAARFWVWPAMRVPAMALHPLMVVVAVLWWTWARSPSQDGGWLAWPIAFLTAWRLLRWLEDQVSALASALHIMTLWLFALLAGWELSWQMGRVNGVSEVWSSVMWMIAPVLLLQATGSESLGRRWPLSRHAQVYRAIGGLGLATMLVVWSAHANINYDGDPAPLAFIPLLNPLDIAQGIALACMAIWATWLPGGAHLLLGRQRIRAAQAVISATAFVWLNAALLRTIHHWAGIGYDLRSMYASTLAQTSLSIFWTTLAMAGMVWSSRRGRRLVWFAGAALMAVVVLKLFLVDLSRTATVARIVSFLVVGVLMLVLGYFSPLPPAHKEEGA